MYCSKCGAEIKDTCKFCPKCGAKAASGDVSFGNAISSIDFQKMSEQTKNAIGNIKNNIDLDRGVVGENKLLYFSGMVAVLLQAIFFFMPMINFNLMFIQQSTSLFDLWKEMEIGIAGFVKVMMIILYIFSLIAYSMPLISKKTTKKKFYSLATIISIVSLILFLLTIIILYYSASNTSMGDFSSVLSLKAPGWFYLIFDIGSLAVFHILKGNSKKPKVQRNRNEYNFTQQDQ